MQKFSLLISIYFEEKPEYFDKAMISVWDEQTIKPNEIILVQDGPLNKELYDVIHKWKENLGDILKTISLEKNVGLANALNIGLQNCRYELVARMDTDDIAVHNRFEKQLDVFKNTNIDICGSWISEFDKNENEIISHRRLPEMHQDIVKYAKSRCPINHPSVMYKKTVVKNSGGYKKIMQEDYYLWIRMILNNAKFYNIQDSLINMRAGYGQLERRRGVKYAINEIILQSKFLKLGFINIFEFKRNVTIRTIARVVPRIFLKKIYILLRQ